MCAPQQSEVTLAASPRSIAEAVSILTAGSNAGCAFQEKLDAIVAAGYDAGIIFNRQGRDALQQFPTAATGTIPLMFVNRLTGLQLLGVPGVTAETAGTTPTPAAPAVCETDVKSEFVGWGYLRLFKTDIPAGTATQIDTYAVPEAHDPTYATGFGDFTAGHVAIDPTAN